MGEVVHLDDYRPHIAGDAVCLVCQREWVVVAPVGTKKLQCPDCRLLSGVFDERPFTIEELTDD